ncbi:MAG: putative Rieske (2Fe-2S) ferredoxin [Roseomonas sp.]|nr:putative Rieske (2Fe-2S) ferredoxin [Roseomonas sp.]
MAEQQGWTPILAEAEIARGTAKGIEVAGRNIAVYQLEDSTLCATDNVCTHAFVPPSEGWFEDCLIECPLHGGQFDVRTGQAQGAPVDEDLRTHAVRVTDGMIEVMLDEAARHWQVV